MAVGHRVLLVSEAASRATSLTKRTRSAKRHVDETQSPRRDASHRESGRSEAKDRRSRLTAAWRRGFATIGEVAPPPFQRESFAGEGNARPFSRFVREGGAPTPS